MSIAADDKVKRQPLAQALAPRTATSTADSALINCYVEQDPNWGPVVRKRFGIAAGYATGAGNFQGATVYKNAVYSVVNDVIYQRGSAVNAEANGVAWTQATAPTWPARAGLSMLIFNDTMFIFGGSLLPDVWQSNDGLSWGQCTSAAPFGLRYAMGACVFKGKMWIAGGGLGAGYANDVWSSEDGINWTSVIPDGQAPWAPRLAHALVAAQNGMYLYGGYDGAISYNDVWFSADGVTWEQVTAAASWAGRYYFGYTYFQNKLWVIGGTTNGNEVWSSPDGRTWTRTTMAAFATARQQLVCVVYAGKMWAIGGTDGGGLLAQVYSSPDGIAWTLVTTAPGWTARAQLAAGIFMAPTSNSPDRYPTMWIVGGVTGTGVVAQAWYANINSPIFASKNITPNVAGQRFQFDSLVNKTALLMKNESQMWVVQGNALIPVTDPNFPAVTVPGLVVLDQYALVMDQTGTIFNSKLYDAQHYNSLDFIQAYYADDGGVALAKHLNYVVAFKDTSIQFFYDAGNQLGSPLGLVPSANARIGCASADTVVSMDNTLVFVAKTEKKGRMVVILDGTIPTPISDAFVNRILNGWDLTTETWAFNVKTDGHNFYVLTNVAANRTLAYDFETKQWILFTSLGFFAWVAAVSTKTTDYIFARAGGAIGVVDPSTFQDQGAPIIVQMTTAALDYGSNQRKFCGALEIIGDKVASTLSESHTDDDFTTFSASRNIDLSAPRSRLTRMGSFRRRAHRFIHIANTGLRLYAYDAEFEKGTG